MKLDRVIAVRNDKTIYRDGDVCIKVFHANYTKADVLNEALNHAKIEETGLNIPKILEVSMIDGKWAIVSEYVKGKTLARLMEENPDKKNEYLDLLVNLQVEVQSKTCLPLNKLKDQINKKIYRCELEVTTKYDLHARLEAMPRHNKVCHGDFTPANIIITEEGTPYILDWSHVTQGNASADAVITYLAIRLTGDEEAAEKYLELFCQKSNTAMDYVRKWIPIIAASQSSKGNEKERELLLSWSNVLDYE